MLSRIISNAYAQNDSFGLMMISKGCAQYLQSGLGGDRPIISGAFDCQLSNV